MEYDLITSSCRSIRSISPNIFIGEVCNPSASRSTLSRLRFVIIEFCILDISPWSNPFKRQNSDCFRPNSANRPRTNLASGVCSLNRVCFTENEIGSASCIKFTWHLRGVGGQWRYKTASFPQNSLWFGSGWITTWHWKPRIKDFWSSACLIQVIRVKLALLLRVILVGLWSEHPRQNPI